MKMDPAAVYRLIRALSSTRNLVPIIIASITILAIIGIIQPLGEVIEDDGALL